MRVRSPPDALPKRIIPMLLSSLDDMVNNPVALLEIADWIEENHSSHPESAWYAARLRSNATTLQNVVDIIAKFGKRQERKAIRKLVKKTFPRKALRRDMRGTRVKPQPGYKPGREDYRKRRIDPLLS